MLEIILGFFSLLERKHEEILSHDSTEWKKLDSAAEPAERERCEEKYMKKIDNDSNTKFGSCAGRLARSLLWYFFVVFKRMHVCGFHPNSACGMSVSAKPKQSSVCTE